MVGAIGISLIITGLVIDITLAYIVEPRMRQKDIETYLLFSRTYFPVAQGGLALVVLGIIILIFAALNP